jgi:uncharacterized protein
MPRLITEKSFYQFIKCPNWVYFDAHALEPKPHDPLLLKLLEEGLIEEKQRAVLADREDLVEVTAEDPERAFEQTLAFMREGRQTIYRGVLIDKHWVGHPDVLERVEGQSHFGNYYYIAADIKRARQMRDDYAFQGCFYAELLEKIQGVRPQQGYVISSEGEVLNYLIESFASEYKLTLDAIEAIVAGDKPAHFVTSGCKNSPWFSECKAQARSCDDLSLLNRVWGEEIARLRAAGILTVEQLSQKSIHQLTDIVPDIRPDRMELLHAQAVALQSGKHIIRGRADLPEARVEIFFDIESDPLRDFDYLFGALVVHDGIQEYVSFLAEYPDQEGENWRAFVRFIESHMDAPIYHYGGFEQDVVAHFSAKYGVSELAREAFERNMIDLIGVIRASVIFPLSFYSLKDIAAYIGFEWRTADASGANSVLWAEEWLKHKSEDVKRRILEYNEDDCRATWIIQRWLRETT